MEHCRLNTILKDVIDNFKTKYEKKKPEETQGEAAGAEATREDGVARVETKESVEVEREMVQGERVYEEDKDAEEEEEEEGELDGVLEEGGDQEEEEGQNEEEVQEEEGGQEEEEGNSS